MSGFCNVDMRKYKGVEPVYSVNNNEKEQQMKSPCLREAAVKPVDRLES